MYAETCSCGARYEGASLSLLDSFRDMHTICRQAAADADPRTLDLIAWSLRLPLLWEQATRVDATPDEQAAERARLDALITEGERALGILPEADDE